MSIARDGTEDCMENEDRSRLSLGSLESAYGERGVRGGECADDAGVVAPLK